MRPVQEFIQFCDNVRANDDHECWSMTWLETLREGRSLFLRLAVDTGADDRPSQIWEVGSHQVRGFSLVDFEFTDWTLSEDHALLWDHQEPFSQLNFVGPRTNHESLLWRLYERHRAVAWPWIPFDRYLTPAVLECRLSAGCGVLADGPERLLREYAAVLAESDLEPYFPYPPRPAHRWDEDLRCWVDADERLSVLILGGASYIVGSDFCASRVE
jgi:hypothetical protein